MPGAHLTAALARAGAIALGPTPPPPDTERCRDARHGDYASHWPLKLAAPLGRSPVAIATALAAELAAEPAIAAAVVAPTGHLNLRLADAWMLARLLDLGAPGGIATVGAQQVKFESAAADSWHGRLDASQETLGHPGFRVRYAAARLAGLIALAHREGLAPWTPDARLDLADPPTRALALLVLAVDDERRFAAGRGGDERLERYGVKLSEAVLAYTMQRPLFGSPLGDAPARLGLLVAADAACRAAGGNL